MYLSRVFIIVYNLFIVTVPSKRTSLLRFFSLNAYPLVADFKVFFIVLFDVFLAFAVVDVGVNLFVCILVEYCVSDCSHCFYLFLSLGFVLPSFCIYYNTLSIVCQEVLQYFFTVYNLFIIT